MTRDRGGGSRVRACGPQRTDEQPEAKNASHAIGILDARGCVVDEAKDGSGCPPWLILNWSGTRTLAM